MCVFCDNADCFYDRHHYYWPRSRYKTPLEREFRGLFIERMPRCLHVKIHLTQKPPRKPSRKIMERVVATTRREQSARATRDSSPVL